MGSYYIDSIRNFRPWLITSWPTINNLLILIPIIPFVKKFSLIPAHFLDQCPISSSTIIKLLLMTIVFRLYAFIKERRKLFQIFDKGHVPSVDNKNLFSGNLFEVIVPFNNLEIIHNYHNKLGKSFGMFYGPAPWVFTTDLDLLNKMFVTEGNKYVDSTQYRLPFIHEMNTSLAGVQGDDWRRSRRILQPPFSHRQMKSDNAFELIDKAINKLMNCIASHKLISPQTNSDDINGKQKNQQKSSSSFRIVDLEENFKKFTIETIFLVAYGREGGVNWNPDERDKLITIIHDASQHIRSPFVWTSIMFESTQKILGFLSILTPLYTAQRYIHSILDDTLNRRRALQGQLNHKDRKMIDSIIEGVDTNKMTDDQLKANLFFIFLAGFETSSNTLTVLFWYLARNQIVQDKLRSEVIRSGENAQYLDWCIQETLRLFPAVPTAVGRVAVDDIELNGQTFYKGTSINASIYSIHHSKEYWGEDVEEFKPERFEKELGHPMQYFAFGHGPRHCLGMHLAMAEMKSIIPRLVLKYRIETIPETPEKLNAVSPNLIHWIIHGRVDVKFTEISSL